MSEILHTNECSKRHCEAEVAIKASLFQPDCPRCRLNAAAPDLLAACKETLARLDSEAKGCAMIPMLKSAIAKAGKEG